MNEPAFPVPMIPIDRTGGHTEVRCLGMTMLDYFAAHASEADLEPYLPKWADVFQYAMDVGIDIGAKATAAEIKAQLRVRARWAHAAEMLRQRHEVLGRGEAERKEEERKREELLSAMGRSGI